MTTHLPDVSAGAGMVGVREARRRIREATALVATAEASDQQLAEAQALVSDVRISALQSADDRADWMSLLCDVRELKTAIERAHLELQRRLELHAIVRLLRTPSRSQNVVRATGRAAIRGTRQGRTTTIKRSAAPRRVARSSSTGAGDPPQGDDDPPAVPAAGGARVEVRAAMGVGS
jgi:hypothetical protein